MRHRTVIIVALGLVLALASALPALAAADLAAAVDYLRTQQNADGGFGSGYSPDSTLGSTADVVLAIVAAGQDPTSLDQGDKTPLDYLQNKAASASTGGDLAKLIMAAVAAGQNPRSFGGVDSVARLEAMATPGGKIGGDADIFVSHLLAILALKSVERPIPQAAIDYVRNAQQENGGWAWDGSRETEADTNSTAFALQALIASGEAPNSDAVTKALAYYKGIQNEDGGWPYQSPSDYGTASDANSTAVTIQALIAAGIDPAGSEFETAAGSTPVLALESFQNASGAFAWQASMPDDNLLATVQALPALAGKAFPLATRAAGEAAAATAGAAAPGTMPQTGGQVLSLALPLILGGLALAGGGYALHRKR